MQARFPGTCRDCGTKFPAGTDIDWQKGKGASCCNGTPQVAPQADRAFIVDGAMKMEWVAEKTYMEGVAFQGDSVTYEEMVYSGYNWMCVECRLVWGKQHQGINCGSRGHAASYEDTYGVKEVRNGVPTGPNMYTITRTAVRRERNPREERELSKARHLKNNEPAPERGPAMTYMPDAIAETMEGVSKDLYAALWQIAAKLPYERLHPGEVGTQELTERQIAGRMKKNGASAETIANLKEVLRKDKEELDSWMNESAPQVDPQDMTSEEMLEDWDAALQENFGEEVLEKVQEIRAEESTAPTITTEWN